MSGCESKGRIYPSGFIFFNYMNLLDYIDRSDNGRESAGFFDRIWSDFDECIKKIYSEFFCCNDSFYPFFGCLRLRFWSVISYFFIRL